MEKLLGLVLLSLAVMTALDASTVNISDPKIARLYPWYTGIVGNFERHLTRCRATNKCCIYRYMCCKTKCCDIWKMKHVQYPCPDYVPTLKL